MSIAMRIPPALALIVLFGGVAGAGVALVSHGPPDVVSPPMMFEGGTGVYGIGTMYQVGPTTAALFANVRTVGVGHHDFEDGTDAFLFDSLRELAHASPVVLSRNEREKGPAGASRLIVKFPVIGGFVPLGARRADGTPRPGAGTGFGIAQALSFAHADNAPISWKEPFIRYVELHQLRFDGKRLSTRRSLIRAKNWVKTADGAWGIMVNGLSSAIPDGDDLLFACTARGAHGTSTGVARWSFADGAWAPETFVPIAAGSEPSLVRDAAGALVFSRRGNSPSQALELWRSEDGLTWDRVLAIARRRTASPVAVNRGLDGSVFIAGNLLGTNRDRLVSWEMTPGLDGVNRERVLRDCTGEFGTPPEGTFWACDHPSGAVVRLGDGQWHALLAYRILAFPVKTATTAEPIVPQTGCHIEELFGGEAAVLPPWRF